MAVSLENNSDFLQKNIEALIFCSSVPLKPEEIRNCLSEMLETQLPLEDIELGIQQTIKKYQSDHFAFQVYASAGGYQFLTKPEYQPGIQVLLKQKSKKRLSNAALETVAIIAYKQPITKGQIEQIRGVNCDYAIQKLLEKELIEIKGKSEAAGRPLLYGTSARFMDYFGINSLKELPTPRDFSTETNEIGSQEG